MKRGVLTMPTWFVVFVSVAVVLALFEVAALARKDSSSTTAPTTTVARLQPTPTLRPPPTTAATTTTTVAPVTEAPTTTMDLARFATVYGVTGTGTAMVTYSTPGGTAQATVHLPWSFTIPATTPLDFAYVSAQLDGTGSISCSISDGAGTVQKANTSTGQYVIASCS